MRHTLYIVIGGGIFSLCRHGLIGLEQGQSGLVCPAGPQVAKLFGSATS